MSEMHDGPSSTEAPSKTGGVVGVLWKDRSTKGKIGVAIAAFFLLSVVGAMFSEPPTSEEPPSTTSRDADLTSTSEATPTTEATTASQRLAEAVSKETGKTNIKGYGDRIQLIEVSEEQTLIRMLGDENLSSGLTKGSNRKLVLEAITAYQSAGVTSQYIAIEVYFPLVDNLGTEDLYRVLGYGFTQERIMAITPSNIDTKRMDFNFADEFTFVHPAFRW